MNAHPERCPTCHAIDSRRTAAGFAWCRLCGADLPTHLREVAR